MVKVKQPWRLNLEHYYFQRPETEESCSDIGPSCLPDLSISDKECDGALQILGYNPGNALLFNKSHTLLDGNLDTFEVFPLDRRHWRSWNWNIDRTLISDSGENLTNISLRLHPGPEDGCFEAFYGRSSRSGRSVSEACEDLSSEEINIRAQLGDRDCTAAPWNPFGGQPLTFDCEFAEDESPELQLHFPQVPGETISLAEIELRVEGLLDERPAEYCRSAFEKDLRICACRPHITVFGCRMCWPRMRIDGRAVDVDILRRDQRWQT